jgi:hypothetical protein
MVRVPDGPSEDGSPTLAGVFEHAMFLIEERNAREGLSLKEKPAEARRLDWLEEILADVILTHQPEFEARKGPPIPLGYWTRESLDRLIEKGWRCERCGKSAANTGGVRSRFGGPVNCRECTPPAGKQDAS